MYNDGVLHTVLDGDLRVASLGGGHRLGRGLK